MVPALLRRVFDHETVRESKAAYEGLISRMRTRDYPVEIYELFFMADERAGQAQACVGVTDSQSASDTLVNLRDCRGPPVVRRIRRNWRRSVGSHIPEIPVVISNIVIQIDGRSRMDAASCYVRSLAARLAIGNS
jgi:hypothetical protein